MQSLYFRENELFVDSVRRLVTHQLEPRVDEWEKNGRFPNEVFTLLAQHGFLGLLISEEWGGIGGDLRLAAAWCETFGELPAVGLTVAVNMHSLVISLALDRLGTQSAKERWLPKALQGEAIGAYAFTEPGAGSDLANSRMSAVKKGDKWVLNGTKIFITNGARADFILVLTRTDPKAGYKGFTTFVVDTKTPGFSVTRTLDKLGWHCSDTAELLFDNVEVDESCILGQVGEGWIQASNSLTWERLMLALTTLGGMRAVFRATLRYSRERKAFGKAIGEFGIVQSDLERMLAKVTYGESLAHHCIDTMMAGKPARAEAAMAKRLICDDALWMADRAIQIHGGYGYTTEFRPERWWRDLRLMPIGGGTSEIMANVARKELAF